MSERGDVVVVGAGIVGCATASLLARRGARVVVVERASVAGEQSRKNRGFVPALPPLQVARSWAGYIDATPDLVPVIGEVPVSCPS